MRIRQEHAYSPPAGRGGGADQSNAALPSCRQRRGGQPVLRFSSALPARCRAKEAQHLFGRHDRPSPREGTKRCPVVLLKNATSRFDARLKSPSALHLVGIPSIYLGQVCLRGGVAAAGEV